MPVARRAVGSAPVSISRIGLGGYELGPEPGEVPDIARAVRVIEAAIESGVNWLDTSENYLATENESLIGAALGELDDDFLIASKVAPRAGLTGGGSGFRPEQVARACRESLQRLGRDHLDIYFLHWPDDSGIALEETWGAMAQLVEVGLVRAIGLSNYELEEVECCHRERPVDAVQVGLSLIDYVSDRDYISKCGELGVAVTIYEPIAGGILSGKTLAQVQATWEGPWRASAFYKRLLSPGMAERSFAVADAIRPIAARLDVTVAQLAIAWVLHQPGVSAAIAGSRSEIHTRENAGAEQLALSDELLDEIEALIPLGPSFGSPE